MTDAAKPTRLTLAHQALANLLAFAAVKITTDDREELAISALAEVLAAATRDVPPGFQPMIEAAQLVLEAWPARLTKAGSEPWLRASFRANSALADFFFWRGAMAMDAWRGADATTATPTGASQNAA